ncbi:MAG: fructose 1,6-bisphosphatase [Deltaproteobacteria bacterium]|nr:fructose 1,6-bisphosphatase [Deltaproteobacteria bacterium]
MENFYFKLEGPIFQNGVPIHVAIKAWENFLAIIDNTYLIATNLQKISNKEREKYYLKALTFKHSSFHTNFEIVCSGSQLVLPLIGFLGPQNLWEYTKEAFNLLKLMSISNKNAKIVIKNNQNTVVNTGDTTIHYHGPVYQIAEKSLPKYKKLAHMLDPGKIETISAGEKHNPEMVFKLEDKNLFDLPTEIQKNSIEVKCEIFTFNKFKNDGKLRIPDGQAIPRNDYSFSIFGNQDNINYIHSMLKNLVTIECRLEFAISPLGSKLISKLHIIGIIS